MKHIRLNSKNQDNEMFIHSIILIKNLTTSNYSLNNYQLLLTSYYLLLTTYYLLLTTI
jgi:hypothetical protein